METKLTYKISPRLFTEDKAFGPGVAALLHRVDDLHSLRAAAMSMGMAYSKAWTIVKNSENAFGFKFLTSTAGGKGGGGAVLTAECRALLVRYDTFCEKMKRYGDALFAELFAEEL